MSNVSIKEAVSSPYEQEKTSDEKLMEKAKKEPFIPIGIVGACSMLAYGAYKFRHKGEMSTSMYLMHLRVQTQSMVVGAITMGITYSLIKDYWNKTHPTKE